MSETIDSRTDYPLPAPTTSRILPPRASVSCSSRSAHSSRSNSVTRSIALTSAELRDAAVAGPSLRPIQRRSSGTKRKRKDEQRAGSEDEINMFRKRRRTDEAGSAMLMHVDTRSEMDADELSELTESESLNGIKDDPEPEVIEQNGHANAVSDVQFPLPPLSAPDAPGPSAYPEVEVFEDPSVLVPNVEPATPTDIEEVTEVHPSHFRTSVAQPEDQDVEIVEIPSSPTIRSSTLPSSTMPISSSSFQSKGKAPIVPAPEPEPEPEPEPVPEPQSTGPPPLSTYTCPICFAAPTNATLTPCGHIFCGDCLFTAVKTTMWRAVTMMAPEPAVAKCPVCRAVLKGWDGRGGGVIGLNVRTVLSL